ncbi:MAG: hypothetical protein WBB42_09055 [Polyangiales bacterium]
MHRHKKIWLAINVVGGIAVLGSYAHGLITHAQTRDMLWGNMPTPLQSIYGVTMWLATAGYLVFMHQVFFRVDAGEARVGQHSGFGVINACCALVVFPSALWLPLTFAYLDRPSTTLWLVIRTDLFLVGIGAIGLIVAMFNLRPRFTNRAGVIIIVALLAFALQTAFLDPFVWPAFFRTS